MHITNILVYYLEIAQWIAIRDMTNARYNEACSPLFKRINISKFKDLCDLHVKLCIYNVINDVLPDLLFRIYKYHVNEHEHNTSHITNLSCPIVNTELKEGSTHVQMQLQH